MARSGGGGGFDGDLAGELFELMDEVALAAGGVVAPFGASWARRCQITTRR